MIHIEIPNIKHMLGVFTCKLIRNRVKLEAL